MVTHAVISAIPPSSCGGGVLGGIPVLGPILTSFVNLLLALPFVGSALQPIASSLGC